jgi:hypothetical protein
VRRHSKIATAHSSLASPVLALPVNPIDISLTMRYSSSEIQKTLPKTEGDTMTKPALLGRRAFWKLCSACAAVLTQTAKAQDRPAPQTNRTAVRNRKNFVAIQVKPYAWVDEGVDQLLDNIQQKGAVNTVWAYTYDYSESRMTHEGNIPLPDRGVPGSPEFVGGAFYDYDPKYFRDRAAFGAGADGVVLSREYVEMWLANLSAAGETLREIFKQRPA